MPKVSEEYRAAKRIEIEDAALRAFLRKGFQAASMADIIAEAGVSAGAIYGTFASKADIVQSVATRIVSALILDMENLAEAEPMVKPGDMLASLMHGMLAVVEKPAILVQLWGEAMTDEPLGELATAIIIRLRAMYTAYIATWHRRTHGLSQAEADALATEQTPLFVAASQGFILQRALFADFDAELYLARVAKHLPS
ncbi:TetR/AcrR family transcriptional regulator [Plantibacter sp. YIM 135249]|jgi:AcrR family transcriptional regulator|uniref:TetR/AcrR family transcriptional regulator n=1 Tax=Plantibacter sp. YIM 135249 TaxID=3423918 RepID=UPI003D33CA93